MRATNQGQLGPKGTADDSPVCTEKVAEHPCGALAHEPDPFYHCKRCGGKGTCYCDIANNE